MNRPKPFENHIYSIAIPDRDFDQRQVQVQERDVPREGISWFIPNSPPLPNDNFKYRRYRRGLDRQPEIEMMLIDHHQQTRREQGRARVVPQHMGNERRRVCIPIQNLEAAPVPVFNEISFPRWSLFQVWNNLAYVTCSVSYRIAWEDQEGKYVIKFSRVQQVLYGFQQIFSMIEMVSWMPQFTSVLAYHKGPLKYVHCGYLVLRILARVSYIKTTTFGMKDFLQVHSFAMNSRLETGYQIKMGKTMTFVATAGYTIYMCGYSALDMAIYTFRDQKSWDWGLAEFIQTFACYARQVFTWATEDACPDDIFLSVKMLPGKEIIYGCFGMAAFASGILSQIYTILLIMSSCLSLLSASQKLSKDSDANNVPDQCPLGNENREAPRSLTTRYEFLEQFSGKISSFVGLTFLLVLGVMGVSLSYILDEMFNQYRPSVLILVAVLPILLMIISCIGACVSALQIDTLESKLTEDDNVEQLPNDLNRLIIYLHRLFKRSAGIGYRGLFVMNFVYLVSYYCAVASLVVFTYETKKP